MRPKFTGYTCTQYSLHSVFDLRFFLEMTWMIYEYMFSVSTPVPFLLTLRSQMRNEEFVPATATIFVCCARSVSTNQKKVLVIFHHLPCPLIWHQNAQIAFTILIYFRLCVLYNLGLPCAVQFRFFRAHIHCLSFLNI